MASPSLDLKLRHFVTTRRGLTAIGSWLFLDDGQVAPCLVLVRAGEELSELSVPCVVPWTEAVYWGPGFPDKRHAIICTAQFCTALRLAEHPSSFHLVRGLIEDLLGDLLHIPPFPPARPAEAPIAELTVTDHGSGRVVHEALL